MPIPFILGAAAAVAGITGVGSGVSGAVKMKSANDDMREINYRHNRNNRRLVNKDKLASENIDKLGTCELEILKSFDSFSDMIEKIQNRPEFEPYNKDGVKLPKFDKETIKEVSVGAGVLMGGLGGAAIGTAGAFAASGATTAAVMALGTASTGTAIASLSGAAATNATLAALGGGAIAAGGGGMALGTAILGATTLGVGLLAGGLIFNATGRKLSEKTSEARKQMLEAEERIDKICYYYEQLISASQKYVYVLTKVFDKYTENFNYLNYVVNVQKKYDWNNFSDGEKLALQNEVLLVGLLYEMCKLNLIEKSENEKEMNEINYFGMEDSISKSNIILSSLQ